MAERGKTGDEKNERVTKPSVGEGPTQDQEREGRGASLPQGRRSQVASSDREMDEQAEFVAASHVQSVAPARAREEAQAAERRGKASDPEQAKIEQAVASKLYEVADRYDATQKVINDRARIQNRGATPRALGGAPSGPLGEPVPSSVQLGTVVVYHTPQNQADTTAMVIGVWPEVPDDPDDPKSKANRWRANLELFPLHGSPGAVEGIAYGSGSGQFEEAAKVEEPQVTADTIPARHEIA